MNQNQHPQMPLPIGSGTAPQNKSTRLAQQLARLQDEASASARDIEKKLARARYAVGGIVLDDPTLFELVAPKLDTELQKLGSARKAVDDYNANKAELVRLREFLK